MRLLAFLVFLLFCAYALSTRYLYVCKILGACEDTPVVVEDPRLANLQLTEDGRVLLAEYDQFAFDTSVVSPDLNDNNRLFLDTLARMLQADSSKYLTITGFARESEVDIAPGFFENIGTARADAVRRLLMSRGIDESRIKLDHGISIDEALSEPLQFEFYTPADRPDSFENISFSFTNMTYSDANFAFDSDEFRPGSALMAYADSVKTYLDINPEKNLTIIGHTDNKGTDAYNYDLGLRRAKSAREYFVNLGILSEIAIDSKGEQLPATDNKTEAGRQKNRRVNFVLE